MQAWKERCYFDDIPDEVTNLLISSGRVPSYKAIALCLLKNDMLLKGLGFEGKYSKWSEVCKEGEDVKQLNIFYSGL